MAICGVVASESLLTYDTVRSGGKQHLSVTLEGIPCSALHLTLPEQAPTPRNSDTFLEREVRRLCRAASANLERGCAAGARDRAVPPVPPTPGNPRLCRSGGWGWPRSRRRSHPDQGADPCARSR